MSGFIDVFRVLFVPALIAGGLYLFLAHAIIPLIRKHRDRYRQYLPLDSLSERTSSIRERMGRSITSLALPRWRRDEVVMNGDGDELAFGEEEGESMVGFDVNRRDRGSVRGGNVVVSSAQAEMDSTRRLSRDLEEGFKDDSEEESGDDRRRR